MKIKALLEDLDEFPVVGLERKKLGLQVHVVTGNELAPIGSNKHPTNLRLEVRVLIIPRFHEIHEIRFSTT
jgi:hypothetical protein